MNCDPSKSEVAAAQSYFAAKTREAELRVPTQSEEIEKLKLQLELAKVQLDIINNQKALMDQNESITSAPAEALDLTLSTIKDFIVPERLAGLKLSLLATKIDPDNSEVYKVGMEEIAHATPKENRSFTVTELAKELCSKLELDSSISAQKLNSVFIDLGLQNRKYKIKKKDGQEKRYSDGYVLTDNGKRYGEVLIKHDDQGSMRENVYWLPEVLELVVEAGCFK